MGVILIFGAGFIFAGADSQMQTPEKVQQRAGRMVQTRLLFVDENGDGICDFARDHDNDGIPNCQDPDWERPQDGTGNMNGKSDQSGSGQFRNGSGNLGGHSWGKHDFGQNQGSFGGGICDGTGPKGKNNRGGRR